MLWRYMQGEWKGGGRETYLVWKVMESLPEKAASWMGRVRFSQMKVQVDVGKEINVSDNGSSVCIGPKARRTLVY